MPEPRRRYDLVETSVDVRGVPCPVEHCAAHIADVRDLSAADVWTLNSNRFNPCGDATGDYYGGVAHRGRIRARKRWEERCGREHLVMPEPRPEE